MTPIDYSPASYSNTGPERRKMKGDTAFNLSFLIGTCLLCNSLCAPGMVEGRSRSADPGVMNIHIVPHTHDDAGWLKTVDQYYYGSNNTIQVAGVQYILDSVVAALQQDGDRTFVYGEVAFFARWWAEQEPRTKRAVRRLVERGQLSFVNGGYVQHCEATAHYVGMIDQTTRGHRWLARELGMSDPPRVGWQIDPFGHSRTHSSMMASFAGMDALFFGRIDYQDNAARKASRSLEMLWEAGASYGPAGDCFAGAFYSGNYGPPLGFNWDHGTTDDPMQDDPRLKGHNVEQRLKEFVEQVDLIASWHRGHDIMLTMGSDFQYMNANHWFRNLDKLIQHLNSHPVYSQAYRAFYSSPEAYVAAKHSYNASWPTKGDDFFPYADCPHCYWTGYFSSKAASKRYARAAASYLQAARQLEAAVGRERGPGALTTDALEEAVSLLQHHDGITGTAKTHVVNDYHQRLATGWAEARQVVKRAMRSLLATGPKAGIPDTATSGPRSGPEGHAALHKAPTWDEAIMLGECPRLNASMCPPSVKRVAQGGQGVGVLLYNPLSRRRTVPVRIPIGNAASVIVKDAGGNGVVSQIVPLGYETLELLQPQEAAVDGEGGLATSEVVFLAEIDPMSFAVYSILPVAEPMGLAADLAASSTIRSIEAVAEVDSSGPAQSAVVLTNGDISLTVSTADGRLTELRSSASKVATDIDHRFLWYRSSPGDEPGDDPGAPEWMRPGSGAYLFRPTGVFNVSTPSGSLMTQIIEGPVVTEVRQSHAPWASTIHRLWRGQPYLESEWTVGPIPRDDGVGREVVSRWSTGLDSGDTCWTDANGREMMERRRDHRDTWTLNVTEPVAGNFYPVTQTASIRDRVTGVELSVVTDRAQAAASLSSGQLELMVHRRTSADDRRGVGEPLNETTCDCHDCDCPMRTGLAIRGRHLISLQPREHSALRRRSLELEADNPPIMMFTAPTEATRTLAGGLELGKGLGDSKVSFLQTPGNQDKDRRAELPANVHLLTLMETEEGTLLLRLAHVYEAGEGLQTGVPACVDVSLLLGGWGNVLGLREVSLTGAPLEPRTRTRRFWAGSEPARRKSSPAAPANAHCAHEGHSVVELKPMQIRTWEVDLQKPSDMAQLE